MTFAQAIKHNFSKYASFEGRASRPEFWWWYLFTIIVFVAELIVLLVFVGISAASNSLEFLFVIWIVVMVLSALALVLPTISVQVRRLHDTHNSGWLWWIQLVPYIGTVVFLVLMILPTYPVSNKYGEYVAS